MPDTDEGSIVVTAQPGAMVRLTARTCDAWQAHDLTLGQAADLAAEITAEVRRAERMRATGEGEG